MATPKTAQSTTSAQGAITLARPGAGQQLVIAAGSQSLLLGFGLDEATLLQDGNDLIFQFDDGSTIVLQGFVDSLSTGDAPSLTLEDGTVLDGQAFATMQGLEIETAAGPGTTSGGSGEYSDDPGLLYDGIDPLDPIGNVDFLNPVPEGPLDEEGLDPGDGGATPVTGPASTLIVGSNGNDNTSGTDTHTRQVDDGGTPVTPGSSTITGTGGDDILIGDAEGRLENANVLIMIDMSTSMRDNGGYDAAKAALTDFITKYNGDTTLNLAAVTFGYNTLQHPVSIQLNNGGNPLTAAELSTLVDATLAALAMDQQPLSPQGTNYDAAFTTGHEWFGDQAAAGSNVAIFVTDGLPTVHTPGSNPLDAYEANAMSKGASNSGNLTDVSDYEHALASYQALVDDFGVQVHTFGLGDGNQPINPSWAFDVKYGTPTSEELADHFDNTGGSEFVPPPDLSEALNNLHPQLGNDLIQGGDGNDLLFGDVLNTDGISSISANADIGPQAPGQGWSIFEKLVAAGETWENVIDYINTHHEQLASNSYNGGNDTLTGGAGNDIIYGQSGNDALDGGAGNDLISGGAGNDILVGGTGADTFVWADGDQGEVSAHAEDLIQGYSVAEGDSINLSDLLSGVSADADLSNNISISSNTLETVITIHADGAPASIVQEITLDGVSIDTSATLNDQLNELNIILSNP
ncbi:type I secretion C-terminal target domain-containing protein [Oleidesulfovibrio sp.]|uniref:type I secretion C-terminal target domain-containing protein n=1 Tax=Oleidesulfovibrio sp. TaxID=2909707 RepID=UPI003A856CF9